MENMKQVTDVMMKQVATLKTRIDAIQIEREKTVKVYDDQLAAVAAEGKQVVAALLAFGIKAELSGLKLTGTKRPMTEEAKKKISDALKASAARKKAAAAQAPVTAPAPVLVTTAPISTKKAAKAKKS